MIEMKESDLKLLNKYFDHKLSIQNNNLIIDDIERFIKTIPEILYESKLTNTDYIKALLFVTYSAALQSGIKFSSFHQLYKAVGCGEIISKFSFPVIDIENNSFEHNCLLFGAMRDSDAHLVGLQLTCLDDALKTRLKIAKIIAAALMEKYSGPLFLVSQDIFFHAIEFESDRVGEIEKAQNLVKSAIDSCIFNLNIDASELVDQNKVDVSERMLMNLKMVAMSINIWIRMYEPKGLTVSVGGKISRTNNSMTTEKELGDFIKRLLKEGLRLRFNTPGEDICKVTVQTDQIDKLEEYKKLDMVAKTELKAGGIVLPLGELNNLKLIQEISGLGICELQFKLVESLMKIDKLKELFNYLGVSSSKDVYLRYIQELKEILDFSSF